MSDLFECGALKRKVVLRTVARDRRDRRICPECGQPLGEKGTVRVPVERAAEQAVREQFPVTERLPSLGYACDRHQVRVVCPRLVEDRNATGLQAGWVGLPFTFADQTVRLIPIPSAELGDAKEAVTDGGFSFSGTDCDRCGAQNAGATIDGADLCGNCARRILGHLRAAPNPGELA